MNEYFYARSKPGKLKETLMNRCLALHHRILKQEVILRISKEFVFENNRLWKRINYEWFVLIIFLFYTAYFMRLTFLRWWKYLSFATKRPWPWNFLEFINWFGNINNFSWQIRRKCWNIFLFMLQHKYLKQIYFKSSLTNILNIRREKLFFLFLTTCHLNSTYL